MVRYSVHGLKTENSTTELILTIWLPNMLFYLFTGDEILDNAAWERIFDDVNVFYRFVDAFALPRMTQHFNGVVT